MELTLLGFVSLIITTFSSPVSRICMDYSPALDSWTMVSNYAGCPCCLKDTQGLTLCSLVGGGGGGAGRSSGRRRARC